MLSVQTTGALIGILFPAVYLILVTNAVGNKVTRLSKFTIDLALIINNKIIC